MNIPADLWRGRRRRVVAIAAAVRTRRRRMLVLGHDRPSRGGHAHLRCLGRATWLQLQQGRERDPDQPRHSGEHLLLLLQGRPGLPEGLRRAGGTPVVVFTQPQQVVEWRIKDEAVWSDGTAVTSEDLRYHQEVLMGV